MYVSSAKDAKLDQELESALVGPVPVGVSKFVLEVWAFVRFSTLLKHLAVLRRLLLQTQAPFLPPICWTSPSYC